MKTIWGEQLSANSILPEYPRPQLKRKSFLNLNGPWAFYMGPAEEKPDRFTETILVPFSPESQLSGIHRKKGRGDILCYRRSFTLPEGFRKGRVLLHFGAVDLAATVSVNGRECGTHRGGYWPFSYDITDRLREKNVIEVTVEDDGAESNLDARGKQSSKPGGIWYTAQSGIWQTVWLESVPAKHITGLRITPLFDQGSVRIQVEANAPGPCLIHLDGMIYTAAAGTPVLVPVENMRPWTPADPYLYPFSVAFGEDRVESYFGMRTCTVEPDETGTPRLCLNHRPLFQNGLLDQGYWPDGLYTPPAEEAMVCDIQTMKALGFNMLRKHIKIEPLRWYYLCDTMGMLVWQDMVSGGGPYRAGVVTVPVAGLFPHRVDSNYKAFGRRSESSRLRYYEELEETVKLLYNCPSIVMWVPFNEGWGQFDARRIAGKVKKLDPTRPVDHASGWHDQGGGDVDSRHVYYKPVRLKNDGRRVLALSEFGGYSLPIPGHFAENKEFGYRAYRGAGEWMDAVEKLYREQVIPHIEKEGLSAAVYTQVSDVEEEVNGMMTFDRRVTKMDESRMTAINAALKFSK